MSETRAINQLAKQLRNRLPEYQKDAAGNTTAIVSPDKTLAISKAGSSVPGQPGETGPQGAIGPKGADGNQIYFGTSPDSVANPKPGDVFVNTTTWDVYSFE